MKFLIPAFAAVTVFAAQAGNNATPEQAELRAECAKSYTDTSSVATPVPSNEYQFVYANGKYKGEAKPGKLLACTEQQYAAYLDKADPAKVMAAYPTAAGRPTAAKKKAEPFRL
ncbi:MULTISPECIES: hypothetical protein [unclassified Roseateles]|uniref:hypothetical protein n=1 Tax=Pelomonas sp. Root1237 TaxID=1736434 RepID=UPI0006FEC929|nr:hypothetical protein [Pelomonas sp. Root1237]KQV94843.1 hypothetical protein ASC91_26580 [Pelomonas sp. Root1237]